MKKEKSNSSVKCPFCIEPGLFMTSRNLDSVCEKHKHKLEASKKAVKLFRSIGF